MFVYKAVQQYSGYCDGLSTQRLKVQILPWQKDVSKISASPAPPSELSYRMCTLTVHCHWQNQRREGEDWPWLDPFDEVDDTLYPRLPLRRLKRLPFFCINTHPHTHACKRTHTYIYRKHTFLCVLINRSIVMFHLG